MTRKIFLVFCSLSFLLCPIRRAGAQPLGGGLDGVGTAISALYLVPFINIIILFVAPFLHKKFANRVRYFRLSVNILGFIGFALFMKWNNPRESFWENLETDGLYIGWFIFAFYVWVILVDVVAVVRQRRK